MQSVALADIAEQFASLLGLAEASGEPDPAKAHLLLLALNDRFTSPADNAQAFMASLRRAIDFQDGDEEGFSAYKAQLISYIERFIADLANRGAQIADLLDRLETAGVSRLLAAAAGREATDALPMRVKPSTSESSAATSLLCASSSTGASALVAVASAPTADRHCSNADSLELKKPAATVTASYPHASRSQAYERTCPARSNAAVIRKRDWYPSHAQTSESANARRVLLSGSGEA